MQYNDTEVKEFIEKYYFNTDDFILIKELLNKYNKIKLCLNKPLSRITQQDKNVFTIIIKSML
jgi:hypothetical protein